MENVGDFSEVDEYLKEGDADYDFSFEFLENVEFITSYEIAMNFTRRLVEAMKVMYTELALQRKLSSEVSSGVQPVQYVETTP